MVEQLWNVVMQGVLWLGSCGIRLRCGALCGWAAVECSRIWTAVCWYLQESSLLACRCCTLRLLIHGGVSCIYPVHLLT